jgi:hypothetical protein
MGSGTLGLNQNKGSRRHTQSLSGNVEDTGSNVHCLLLVVRYR